MMIPVEPDPLLHRVQRDTTVVCAALAVVATVSGGWRAALGVLAGGLVVFVSYRGIKAGVDGLMPPTMMRDRASGDESVRADGRALALNVVGRARTWALVKFITRYGILALLAYVMMVRLRAHPVWMVAGASSFVAAAAVEAVRQLRGRR
jgi:hypothetical protein